MDAVGTWAKRPVRYLRVESLELNRGAAVCDGF
jgi:hypothetical protein